MTRVRALVNNAPVKVATTRVTREGERATDQSKVFFPSCVAIDVGAKVHILQDAVDLDGIVGAYMFQGGAKDESGLCNNAFGSISRPRIDASIVYCCTATSVVNSGFNTSCVTVTGSIGTETGKKSTKAMVFDGSNDFLTLSCSLGLDIYNTDLTSQLSISAWIKTTDTSVPIFAKKASSTTSQGFEVGLDSCGRVQFRMTKTATSDDFLIRGDTVVNTGLWTHITVVYNGVPGDAGLAVNIYINGDEDSKGVTTTNLTSSILNCTLPTIGAYADGSSKFDGSMDQVNIWLSRMLTLEQIASLYNEGITEEVAGRAGNAIRFNGVDSFFEIPYTTDHDFTEQFDIQIWARWQSTTLGYIFTRRTLSGNGIGISVNSILTGDIVADIDGNVLKTTGTLYNDFNWHLIRVNRTSDNVVHLLVDNVEKATSTIGSNLTLLSPKTTIGTNHNNTAYYDGDIDSIRMYNTSLDDAQASRLYSCVTASSIMKFGGYATKVTKIISQKEVLIQSFGKALGETEVRAQAYKSKTVEFIVDDLVRANTDLFPHIHGTPTGITLERFNADGKLIDIVRDLTQLTGKTFNTDALESFHLHDSSFNETCFVFTHGGNAINMECVNDDTEIVNDLVIIGENKKYCSSETFTGDGNTSCFVLKYGAISTEITVNGVAQVAEENYSVCVIGKTITFGVNPPNGHSVVVNYQYEVPLLIRGEKQDSILEHGRHSKRLVMPWIRTRNDGVRFVNGYLNRYKNIRTSLVVELGVMKNSLAEGDVVRIVNSIKDIDDTFVVKSLTWKYPEMKTEVLVGEFRFDDLEYEKSIIEKLHDLESALTEIKDIKCSEQLEEVIVISDSTNVICAVSDGIVFVQSLSLGSSFTITTVSPAIYGSSTSKYNDVVVYGTVQVISGFVPSGFTASGFTV
jgi:hypothetical protein